MGMYRTLFYTGLILAVAFLIAAIVLFFVLKIPKALGVVTGRTQKRAIEEIRSGNIEASSKKKRGSKIHVREVEMETGSLKTGTSNTSGSLGATKAATASGPSVQNAVRDAARDAASDRSGIRPRKDRSKANEQTEVLDFTGSLEKPNYVQDAEDTEVLGGGGSEDATDVLGGGVSVSEKETEVLGNPDDEETDVLTSGGPAGGRSEEIPDEETDVLISGSSIPEDEEIVGRYSAEETAVLRSIHSNANESGKDSVGIKVLYSETIVHTDEAL